MASSASAQRASARRSAGVDALSVGPGTLADYAALSAFHYRAGMPATVARRADGGPAVVRATDDGSGSLVGVLVVSMPTLHASWREAAWPGRYSTGDRRRDAARVNLELRCISRVVVEPRWRGLGVARRLVRAYLDEPLTAATEAVAAMGCVCPFFERAGMTAYVLPPARRDARLLDALWACGVEAWRLTDCARASRIVGAHPWLERELRRWAGSAASTRRFSRAGVVELARLAGGRVSMRMTAYAAVKEG